MNLPRYKLSSVLCSRFGKAERLQNGTIPRTLNLVSELMKRTKQERSASSMNRLLFERNHEETRPIIPDPRLSLPKQLNTSGGSTEIQLGGQSVTLPNVFLRDSCQCPRCVDSSTTQKTFNTGDIPKDIRPSALRVMNNSLEIIWQDNHRSVLSAQFLSRYITREAATQTRFNARKPVVWDKEVIEQKDIDVPYKSYMSSPETLHKVVQNLADYGLAFINGCPSGPEAENQLQLTVERVGPLKSTFYGPTWNVRSVEAAKNVAYTSVDLDLHMDLLYYESPPGLQFLHCLENQVEGGSSVFVDSFAVAEYMRANHPEEFEILCNYLVDFKYENDGVYYHQARPTIVLNKDTNSIEYVNYSPPFQGVQVTTGFADYHRSIAIFAELVADEKYRHELVLKEGQCVVFNNRRTLHARRSFGPGKRWLKGAYCDIDTLWSKYRVAQIM